MREVLADIDALDVPEQLVFNKIDAASAETLLRLRALAPDAVFVSARTGAGLDELRALHRAPAAAPESRSTVLVPYTRGDLVARRARARRGAAHRAHRAAARCCTPGSMPALARGARAVRADRSADRTDALGRSLEVAGITSRAGEVAHGFDSPWHWAVVAIVGFVLFFGWKQLPDMARSLGRSLRIFKTEIKGMGEDDKARDARPTQAPAALEAAAGHPMTPEARQSAPAEPRRARHRDRPRRPTPDRPASPS